MNEGDTKNQARETGFIQPTGPRRWKSTRDLPLVKWTAWLVIAVILLLVILLLWGMATHEPSPFKHDSDSLG
jgi:hypothetical protein